jgi:hypothetical protein
MTHLPPFVALATGCTRWRIAFSIAAGLMAVAVLAAGCEREWKTREITVGWSTESTVVIISPPQGGVMRTKTEILFDRELIFSGRLPNDNSGVAGAVVDLARVRTSAGAHVMVVKHGDQQQELHLDLRPGERRYVHVFGVSEGRQHLILDLGTNPVFF